MTPRQFATDIVRQLQQAGYEALWAGGCVRDQLQGLTPKDYDVATNARPEEIRKLFGFKKTLPIGAAFGVITVIGPKSAGQIEVATFRTDGTYSDGRRPDTVEYSSAEQDAQRRDFTINGLFFDPIAEQVIDYVGGKNDLQNKIIRAIGNPIDRINEDKLRMLRAVRFTATFDFQLDAATATAVKNTAAEIKIVSGERIGAELRRMLIHQNRNTAINLLRELNLLNQIFPEAIVRSHTFANWPSKAVEKNLVQLGRQTTVPIALAAWLGELTTDPRQIDQICRAWKLTVDEIKTANWLIENEPSIRQANQLPWPKIQRILIQPHVESAITLATAIANVNESPTEKKSIEFCVEKLALPSELLNPRPLLTGDDLVQQGMRPGPQFKKLIDQVRDAQLENKIETKSQAIDLAKKIAENL